MACQEKQRDICIQRRNQGQTICLHPHHSEKNDLLFQLRPAVNNTGLCTEELLSFLLNSNLFLAPVLNMNFHIGYSSLPLDDPQGCTSGCAPAAGTLLYAHGKEQHCQKCHPLVIRELHYFDRTVFLRIEVRSCRLCSACTGMTPLKNPTLS